MSGVESKAAPVAVKQAWPCSTPNAAIAHDLLRSLRVHSGLKPKRLLPCAKAFVILGFDVDACWDEEGTSPQAARR